MFSSANCDGVGNLKTRDSDAQAYPLPLINVIIIDNKDTHIQTIPDHYWKVSRSTPVSPRVRNNLIVME